MSDEMTMTVSPVCTKDGETFAFVMFQEGSREAEGKIPACNIVSNKGFSEEEVQKLEDYMKRELTTLKKMAGGLNVLDAMTK